jgi:hypothetical protein
MRKRIYLPKTLEELKSLGKDRIRELWERYFKDVERLAEEQGQEGASRVSTSGETEERLQPAQPKPGTSSPSLPNMLRPLWHKVQCENHNISIDQKNITKLNKYSKDPEGCIEKSFKAKYHIRSGTEIVKTFQGKQFKVLVKSPDEFIHDGKSYRTLSAVAMAICGKKVSGYDFFGLNNKGYEKSIVSKAEEVA